MQQSTFEIEQVSGPSRTPGLEKNAMTTASGNVSETAPMDLLQVAHSIAWAAVSLIGAFEICIATGLEDVRQTWLHLEKTAFGSAFQTYGWLQTWQGEVGRYGNVQPVIVVLRDAVGNPLMLLPLAIKGKSLRRLHWLGSDLCDYNAPVLAADFASRCPPSEFPAIWNAIMALMQTTPGLQFDICDFEKMPERIGALPNPCMTLPVMRNASSAHISTLGTDWEAFYAEKRSAATRKKERKQLRVLAEYGEIRFRAVTEPADVAACLDILFEQKASSFARMGVEDVFARDGYRAFFEKLATSPQTAPMVHLARLDIGDVPAAASCGLIHNGCYYLIISSYTDHEMAKHGPGRVHLAELLTYAIDRKLTHFDFTIGDEGYKRYWADIEMPIYDLARGYSLRGKLAAGGLKGYRLLKRTIKQNPRLWDIYTNMRALIWH